MITQTEKPIVTVDEVIEAMMGFLENPTNENAQGYLKLTTDAWWCGNLDGEQFRTHVEVLTAGLPNVILPVKS